MRETRLVKVNNMEIPVLISDEKEALLAAKAAGRAIVGLWRPDMAGDELFAADYVAENMEAVTGEFLERAVRRHMGLPWKICETKRLLIREMFGDDFDEVWDNHVGHGFGTVEEFLSYTKYQYSFYEFGFWALVQKEEGELAGVAGLRVPESEREKKAGIKVLERRSALPGNLPDGEKGITLELGYHIFTKFRRQGYARESCEAIIKYGEEELGASRFLVQIEESNLASLNLAASLGFHII